MKEINLKELWSEYRELEEKKLLSVTIIRKMLSERSGSEMVTIAKMEWSSLFVFVLLIPLFCFSAVSYGDDFRFLLVSVGGLLASVSGLLWTGALLRRIGSIDFSKDSFVTVKNKTSKIRSMLKLERVVQFVFFPVFLACVLPVLYLMVQGLNIFEDFSRIAGRVLFVYILITAATLFLYKHFYFRKLDIVDRGAAEAEEFSR